MRRFALMACVAALAVLACSVGGSAAPAAPEAEVQAGAAIKAKAKASPQRTARNRVSRLDTRFKRLKKSVRKCAASNAQRARAQRIRNRAIRNYRKAGTRSLRVRTRRMNNALVVLARSSSRCPSASRNPQTITPAPNQPGTPPGTLSGILSLQQVLDGTPVDASPILSGDPLPSTIGLVELPDLTVPGCTTGGAVCVGVDVNALIAALEEQVDATPLLAPVTTPLLQQIEALLNSGQLDELLDVQRLSDETLSVVPAGLLETLLALVGPLPVNPDRVLGLIQVAP